MTTDYRARAALAQPEPEGVTDEELETTAKAAEIQYMKEHGGLTAATLDGIHAQLQAQRLAGLRAVLARWGRPAITPIPVSELLEPEWVRQENQTRRTTDHAQLIDGEWWAPYSDLFSMQRIVDNARAHSARYARPAIAPIPLSERLPGPGDCDAEGRCWVGSARFTDDTDYGPVDFNESWELCRCSPDDCCWLPAHALPLPRQPAPDAAAPCATGG